jgi:hypothetical protein
LILVWFFIEVVSISNKISGLLDNLLSALSLSLSLSLQILPLSSALSAERRSSKASASDRTVSFSDSVYCILQLGLVRNSSGNTIFAFNSDSKIRLFNRIITIPITFSSLKSFIKGLNTCWCTSITSQTFLGFRS